MSELPIYQNQELLSELVETRQRFHRYPELSWTEFHTTARLCEELESLGFRVSWGKALYGDQVPHNLPDQKVLEDAYQRAENALGQDNKYLPSMKGGYTGLVATLDGSLPGQTFGFRFDIDALPITESQQQNHPPASSGFQSQNSGVMHACGHDGHLTIGLGLARRLAANRKQLKGRIHIFFQPAEEVAGGGIIFARLPQLQEVETFMTLHLGIINKRRIVCDATWVAAQIYDVRFSGRASHAGNSPQEGRNALLAACQAVQALYAIPRHSSGMSRVNVGYFNSNNAHNVIADDARFRFEVRGADNRICEYMAEAGLRAVQGAAQMNDVTCYIKPYARFENHPNSPELVREVREKALSLGVPEGAIIDNFQVPASEDATFMINTVRNNGGRATYMILGSSVSGGHHNECFNIENDILGWGVELFYGMVA